ncbi:MULTISPECIES: hypothetical protein [unclassified Rhodococcus (in: high G+C Gram-positive bacteria)]|uniref:hypothetical protein n=1 Tax=Rhodococcus sp. SJ-3 TaxID=3454628 RepID=UPI003F7993F6
MSEFVEQVDDQRRRVVIERRRHFVGDEKAWTARECPSNRDTLSLTAGQLVRTPGQRPEPAGTIDPAAAARSSARSRAGGVVTCPG